MVSVESDTAKIGMTFSTKTRKWDAEINSEEKWEKQMSEMCIRDSSGTRI